MTDKDTGAVVPLTGQTFEMTIKDTNGGTVLLTMPIVTDKITTGIYIPSPTDGIMFLQIMRADSVTVGEGYFPFEIIRTDSDGLLSVYITGEIQFYTRDF
jgi:hypothetical protein